MLILAQNAANNSWIRRTPTSFRGAAFATTMRSSGARDAKGTSTVGDASENVTRCLSYQ
jgi:hypothetical protein